MLKFAVCDDDLTALKKLSHLFESIFIQNNLSAEISLATTKDTELLSYIENNHIDVFVLDIKLNGTNNGLKIANKIRELNKNSYIIFVTGHAEYVFLAYEYKTFDYICKPVTKDRLEKTVLRLFNDITGTGANKKYIRLNNKNTIIDENEIHYIKRDGMKIIFHTKSRDYEVYSSFAKIQNQLPKNFIRCHKSFIANLNNISKIEPLSNSILFSDNDRCDIGPKYKADFMKGVESFGNIK